MALNLLLPAPPIPIFSPQPPTPRTTSTTELRFSRWNNANAEKFTQKQRAQQQIEDDIRHTRRFTSATQITQNYNPAPPHPITVNENFKSIGTPSSPSRPSIPGKKSKYSKPPTDHPAFSKPSKVLISRVPQDTPRGVQVSEDGVSYRVPNAPFEFQYSYTETPKVKPLALREPPFVPFGPTTMPRPWTGRAPLSPSKKKLPEFDSFKLPPPHKKGVKPVQSPGPFLAGMGPKYVQSREEILGDPLMEDEIKELVHGCLKTKRQLNMGRDGLTHNMLDNIHAHWKRRRVCKIKCKGVCTVDMDNVRQQLEEKTGGKIIYSRGGALFLFRGRNYNYRNRPRFPLMLWKPVTPVYPLLIQQVPEGLTLEEAREMRKRGRELQAICKLGKNGVYSGLVEHVKEAFEECELVRVDCQGMNGSDYKKIGAKLKDLVPCVLVSFEFEHILMWRGWDWKSSFLKSKDDCMEDRESATDGAIVNHTVADASIVANEETTELIAQDSLTDDATLETRNASSSSLYSEGVINRNLGLSSSESEVQYFSATSKDSFVKDACESFTMPDSIRSYDALVPTVDKRATKNDSVHSSDYESEPTTSSAPKHSAGLAPASDGIAHDEGSESLTKIARLCSTCTDEVVVLMKKAVEIGSAVILDDASLDADIVFKRSVAFSKAAPPGPVFRNSVKKVLVQKRVKHESSDLEEDVTNVTEKTTVKKSFMNQRIKDFKEVRLDTLPYGSLGVDELAKLLG